MVVQEACRSETPEDPARKRERSRTGIEGGNRGYFGPDGDKKVGVVKERLDTLLVKRGLVPSREKGRAYIMAGLVLVDGRKVDKPGARVPDGAVVRLVGDPCPYVSRGGLKLEGAIQHFGLDFQGAVVLDVGASTGGFTDCALKHGARRVYALDVGYGQLAWKLRCDPRVVVLDRVNARYLRPKIIPEKVDFVLIDVSFISLTKVLPAVIPCLAAEGQILALVKPQFEAGRDKVGKKGLVRDPHVHVEVLEKLVSFSRELGLAVRGLTHSPLKGAAGNIEYFLLLGRGKEETLPPIKRVVQTAHVAL